MKLKFESVPLSDARVVAHLNEATDKASSVRSKIRLHEGVGVKPKKYLRAHRAPDGRFYVMTGYRGHSRTYLAGKCWITSCDGEAVVFEFRLDVIEQRRAADLAAMEARYPGYAA
ncbi:hypothetical protein [Tardiphaga sp. 367_B4_N1_1]|uniref:hypothetical protein n=1 Tax=Tardiphaga sp. 367_B4_N1_1 TaxID=3240777 RepID=UPI003F227D22